MSRKDFYTTKDMKKQPHQDGQEAWSCSLVRAPQNGDPQTRGVSQQLRTPLRNKRSEIHIGLPSPGNLYQEDMMGLHPHNI